MIVLAVAIAGGFGSLLRYTLDRLITRRNHTAFPLGTLSVNLLGATALGVLTALGNKGGLGGHDVTVIGTGLIGGFTTFSTLIYESYFLITQRGRRRLGMTNLAISFSGGLVFFFMALEITLRLLS